MFKEIISSLTQKTLKAANTASGHIADSLVGNLKNRSPVLGDLAGKYLEGKRATEQIGKDQVHAARIYTAENVDKDFGQEVKKENKDLNPQDLVKKMEEILSNLQKVSTKSPEILKADPLYKKYGKFFEENKEQFKASKEKKPDTTKSDTPPDSSGILTKLESIEANTAETAKQIANLTKDKESRAPDQQDSQAPVIAELKKISKFLEIQTQSDKLAAIQAAEDKNEGLDIKKDPSLIKSLMSKLNSKDSNGPESNRSPSLLERVKGLVLGRSPTTANTPGSFRDGIKNTSKRNPTTANTPGSFRDGIKNTSKRNPNTLRDGLKNTAKNKVKIPSGASKLGSAVKSVGSVGARALGGLASFAANPVVLGTAAVAGAGAAGYAMGNWINENTNIQSNIASGIDSVKGLFGNSDEDQRKASEKKAAQDLYEKSVVEGRLTSKSAAFFEQQGVKVDKSKIINMPTPLKSPVIKAVTSTVATQESLMAKPTAQIQPILLNNNTSNSSGSSGIQMLTGVNVRNSDTTFERVQMQDFWPRTE
jgi:hypothetical protein